MRHLDRRRFITGATGAAVAASLAPLTTRAAAQTPDRFVALGHKVHQQIIMGERGGDAKNLAEPWLKEKGIARIEWVTYGLDEIHDKLFREASLPKSTVDIRFLLNSSPTPR